MDKDFIGQKVLVTGATRGIGLAIASLFKNRGAEVVGTGRAKLAAPPPWLSVYWPCDLASDSALEGFCRDILSMGRLDVLVQNAGTNVNNLIYNVNPGDRDVLMRVNLVAPFAIASAACELMRDQQVTAWPNAHIVHVGSIWGQTGKSGRSVYSAAKAAIAGMVRSMAADMAPHGVLVNTVSPGFTKTELTDKTVPAAEQAMIMQRIPLGRFAEPREIARLVVFLCSSQNTYITGQNITIDGGYHNVRI